MEHVIVGMNEDTDRVSLDCRCGRTVSSSRAFPGENLSAKAERAFAQHVKRASGGTADART